VLVPAEINRIIPAARSFFESAFYVGITPILSLGRFGWATLSAYQGCRQQFICHLIAGRLVFADYFGRLTGYTSGARRRNAPFACCGAAWHVSDWSCAAAIWVFRPKPAEQISVQAGACPMKPAILFPLPGSMPNGASRPAPRCQEEAERTQTGAEESTTRLRP